MQQNITSAGSVSKSVSNTKGEYHYSPFVLKLLAARTGQEPKAETKRHI
jgi:hypothetical protein